MAAIAFPQHAKSLTTSTGATYSYVSIPNSHGKPSVLLLHGFPSSCYDWRCQIPHFSSLGYGIIAPDLLGYGSTDRPSDASAYRGKKMSQEIVDILDAEGFNETDKKIHGISHDWGVFLMSRLCNYHPKRFESATFMSVPYIPPGRKLDVDAINSMTKKMQGWEVFGYWKFFDREDAGDVVNEHFDSFYSLIYTADPKNWIQDFNPLGAFETFLKANKTVETASFVTEKDKDIYDKIMERDFSPAMNWYRSEMAGLSLPDDTNATPPLDPKLHLPVLYVESSLDPVSSGERAIPGLQALISDLTVKKVATGHWLQLEKADEVNAILEEFVTGVDTKRKEKV